MFKLNSILGARGNKGHVVSIGNMDFYFSYSTIVAFRTPKHGLICCENIWGSTTGNHLNNIEPDHDLRYDPATFKSKLEEVSAIIDKAFSFMSEDL